MSDRRLLKPPAKIPDKDLRFKVIIRVYGAHGDSTYGHSYIVDDISLGVSAPIVEYQLDATSYTFKELRYLLQYNTTTAGHMKKRSLVFQEALFIMSRLPNIYNRPRVELNQYHFGFVKKHEFDDVKLVHPDRETEPIANLIGRTDFFEHDIILVPLSQMPPDFNGEQSVTEGGDAVVEVDSS